MAKFDFSVTVPSKKSKMLEKATCFSEYPKYFQYINHINIIHENQNEICTEEKISFSFKSLSHEITQKTITKKIDGDKFESSIISGPLKGTTSQLFYNEVNNSTKINIKVDLKVGLKYKFLSPIIKKRLKMAITAVLFKMHSSILESS